MNIMGNTVLTTLSEDEFDAKIDTLVSNSFERNIDKLIAKIQPIPLPDEKKYLTRYEYAKKFHISLPTLHKLMNNGELQPIRIGRRVLLPENAIPISNG